MTGSDRQIDRLRKRGSRGVCDPQGRRATRLYPRYQSKHGLQSDNGPGGGVQGPAVAVHHTLLRAPCTERMWVTKRGEAEGFIPSYAACGSAWHVRSQHQKSVESVTYQETPFFWLARTSNSPISPTTRLAANPTLKSL